MLFVCYPKCTTCQKAAKWLDAQGIPVTVRDIKQDNPTEQELRTWHKMSGLPLKRFFNTSGLQYKALGLKDKLPQMSEAEQFALDVYKRQPHDCLVVKVLRSPHAHALIEEISTDIAMKVPGIECVFTYKDVPQKRFTMAGQTFPEPSPYDRLILCLLYTSVFCRLKSQRDPANGSGNCTIRLHRWNAAFSAWANRRKLMRQRKPCRLPRLWLYPVSYTHLRTCSSRTSASRSSDRAFSMWYAAMSTQSGVSYRS